MEKKLYRSDTDKILAGVCGGIGEYFGIDPRLIRLLVIFSVFSMPPAGIITYIAAWIMIPRPLEAW